MDAFDKNVSEVCLCISRFHEERANVMQGADKAKSGISSWFGSGK